MTFAMGEGWHNNHHYYQPTAKQGFFWWQVDASFYLLKVLIWGLRTPPSRLLKARTRQGRPSLPTSDLATEPGKV